MQNYVDFVAKGTGIVFLGSLISTIVAYLLRIYLARELSVGDYGILYASISLLTSLTIFRDLGLSTALAKFVPEAMEQGRMGLVRIYLKYALLIHFVLTCVVCLPLILLANPIATLLFHDPTASNVLRILAVGTLLSFYSLSFVAFLRGRKQVLPYATFSLVYVLATLVSLHFLFSLAKNVTTASIGFAVGNVIAGIYVAFFALRAIPAKVEVKHKAKRVVRTMISFGLMVFVISTSLTLLTNLDTLLLASLRSAHEVSYYQVAVPTAMLVLFFASSLTTVLLPVLAELWAKKDVQLLSRAMYLLIKFASLVAIPLALLLFLFAEPIVLIFFGREYEEASAALKLLSLAYLFYTLAQVNLTCNLAMDKLNRVVRFVVLVVIVNFLLNLTLIPSLGVLGASLAALLTFVLLFSLTTIEVKFTFLMLKSKFELPLKAISFSFLAAVVTIVSIRVIQGMMVLPPLPKLLILSPIALMIYLLLLPLSGAIEREDLELLGKIEVPVPSRIVDFAKKLCR